MQYEMYRLFMRVDSSVIRRVLNCYGSSRSIICGIVNLVTRGMLKTSDLQSSCSAVQCRIKTLEALVHSKMRPLKFSYTVGTEGAL